MLMKISLKAPDASDLKTLSILFYQLPPKLENFNLISKFLKTIHNHSTLSLIIQNFSIGQRFACRFGHPVEETGCHTGC